MPKKLARLLFQCEAAEVRAELALYVRNVKLKKVPELVAARGCQAQNPNNMELYSNLSQIQC